MHQREVEQHDHMPMTAAEEVSEREELERDRERLWALWHTLPSARRAQRGQAGRRGAR